MKYALDSSAGIKWVLPEPHSARALRLRADAQAQVHELIAPDVFPVEVAHALTRAERRGILPTGHAAGHLANVLGTAPTLHSYLPLLQRATDISSQTRQGVYDCLYVALAEREHCELVTADDKLVKNLQPRFPFIVLLSALP
jgi:predicted nucleic acid-binding protein